MAISVGSETMLDLLEAETKIPAIKSALTNNSAKHDLAFLEDIGSPDDCIMTNQEPIDVGSMHILVEPTAQYLKHLWAPFVASQSENEAWKMPIPVILIA